MIALSLFTTALLVATLTMSRITVDTAKVTFFDPHGDTLVILMVEKANYGERMNECKVKRQEPKINARMRIQGGFKFELGPGALGGSLGWAVFKVELVVVEDVAKQSNRSD